MPRLSNSDTLMDYHRYGQDLYGTWRSFAKEVETVWKGEFDQKRLREYSDIQISRSSEPYALLRKMEEVLAIRSKKRVKVPPRRNTEQELSRVEKNERFLRAYLAEHRRATGKDVFRIAAHFALLRGRGPIQTIWAPGSEYGPDVLMRALDPYDLYPVYGERGIDWWTSERQMTRLQFYQYAEELPEELRKGLKDSGALGEAEEKVPTSRGKVRIIEYWDDEVFAWGVGNTLLHQEEHGYGCVTLREIRLGETGLDDQRWTSMPFLGPVVEDLKALSALQSKMMTAVDTAYFDDVLFTTPDDQLELFDRSASAGDPQQVKEGFTPIILKKDVNHQLMNAMYQVFKGNISKSTLSEVAFALDIPNVSGFQSSQVLSLMKDAISDVLDQMEQTFGQSLGDVLKLHELFGDEAGTAYASAYGEKGGEVVTLAPDEIDGWHMVNVSIKAALPQDMTQKVTILNQVFKRDPVTGMLMFDLDTALEVSKMDEEIEDVAKMHQNVRWDYLLNNDPAAKQLYMESLNAEFAGDLDALRKNVDQNARRMEKRELQAGAKDIQRGLSQDVMIPAELANDPNAMQQLAQMMAGGMTLKAAIDTLQQGGLPMGMPGQTPTPQGMPGGGSPETSQLVQSLFPGAQLGSDQPQDPNGLTGYGGMNPSVMPPAMAGMQPRQVVDQPNVELEQLQEQIRRGGLPPSNN